MLATCWATFGAIYMSYGGCLTAFGAVCWQPTVSFGGWWANFWAIYRSCEGCLTAFGAVCWQRTGLIGVAGPLLAQSTSLMGVA